MSLPPSDLVHPIDGDGAEKPQTVSQVMCDICRDIGTPRIINLAVTRCFVCEAFLCQAHAMYGRRIYRRNPITGRAVPCHPHTAACPACFIQSASESSSDTNSDNDSDSDRSRDTRSRSRNRRGWVTFYPPARETAAVASDPASGFSTLMFTQFGPMLAMVC